jgi:hypothetical protein
MRQFDNDSRLMDYLLGLFIAGLFFSIVILEIAAGLYLLVFVLLIVSVKKVQLKYVDYLFILFVFSGVFSALLSGEYNILMFLIPICFIPISVQLTEKKTFQLELWIKWIILFATITAIIGIIYHYLGRERTTGAYGGYFILATLMSWSITLTVSLFMKKQNKKAVIYLILAFPQVMALWWSATRSAMLALFLGFGIWAFSDFSKNRFAKLKRFSKTFWRWSMAVSPLFLLLLMILASSDPRMNPTVVVNQEQESSIDMTSGRAELISQAVTIIKSDWINGKLVKIMFGYGPFSCQRMVGKPYSSWESDYLHSLMEQGLIGLFLVISIYYLLLKYIVKGLRSDDYLLNALATAGIITFVMSFFTLRITGWHSVGVFIIIYNFLAKGLSDESKI